jgi:PTH1 family peptidyl-tRNA hydrolase
MSTHIQLIVGLGNPGKEYAATRHNVGVWWLHELCARHAASFQLQAKLKAHVATLSIEGLKLRCATSTTYMNDSGLALASLCNYYEIATENVLIVHDELAFAPGEVRLKFDGGHNGHNGLRSIGAHIGTNFYRLRLGIGHPGHKDLVTNYVLGVPSKDEQHKIVTGIENSMKALPAILNKVLNGI